MKYIITESQYKIAEQSIRSERLEKNIMEFFDEHLTPYGGWESPKSYRKDIEDVGEIFFFLVESDGSGEYEHMWYSACDNPNIDYVSQGQCPTIALPESTFNALNGYFGDRWQELFKWWFMTHTELVIAKIETV